MGDLVSGRRVRWRCGFVAALMTSAAAVSAHAAEDASVGAAVQEVVVTATKRSESLQKVPISIQALTPQILENHQVTSFDDYAKLLPSVSFQSFGPGQAQPYFRGISSGGDGLHSGSLPATGVYLDEIPVTTIGNGLDVHLYDVARVEALSGPQGTLFGASSLSGTLRIITNQPDTRKFSAAFDVEGNTYTAGSGGDVVNGYVNIPLSDRIAIRLVGFQEHDGGYIDNIAKTRDFTLTGGAPLTENNARYVKNDFNQADTFGGRAALKIELNDNWTVTPEMVYQNQHAHGNFLYNPSLGDLKVADFSPDYNIDKWWQSALTVKGKIGTWDVVYAGGYFQRQVDNASDYSYYAVAYNAAGASSYVTFPDGHGGFLDPDQHYRGYDTYTKETHELRFSSPATDVVRLIGGAFYERQTDHVIANYIVTGLGSSGDGRAIGEADDIYYTNINRVDRDFALFGEAAFDLLDNLTATFGFRYFSVDNTLDGISGFVGSTNFAKGVTEYGETHKFNLSWKIDPQKMVYFTYSTGFRPGGVNRRSSLGSPPENIGPYGPDTITNYEVGWKTTWLDGALRINGAVFDEEWHDVQYALSPPGAQGITAIFNVGYARSYGVEGDVTYHPDEHWTFSGTGTWLDARITQTFCTNKLPDGTCETTTGFGQAYDYHVYKGARLPIQPPYKFTVTARYEFPWRAYRAFLQSSLTAQGDTQSELVAGDSAIVGPTPSFATLDLAAGFSRDNWNVEVFAQNVTDERGILSKNVDCSVTYCGGYALSYPAKPQFIGIKFGTKY